MATGMCFTGKFNGEGVTFVEKEMYWVGNENKGWGKHVRMDSLRVTKIEEKFLFKMDSTKAVHHTK